VQSVAPERFEDIDCELQAGGTLLIQTKERGVGARAIAAAEVATIISHAVPALRSHDRFAIVTNGRFGSSLPVTGFTASLEERLNEGDDAEIRTTLLDALRRRLDELDVTDVEPQSLLSRIHLVVTDFDISQQIMAALEGGVGVPPAVASLVRAVLLHDLGAVAAQQREASLTTAGTRTLTDLDLIATRVLQEIDVPSLQEAVAAGVCEPADFVTPPSVDLADFFYGIDVIPGHIAAGFDVVRPEETASILKGLSDRRDVVVAGPSGSGKSALLWRSARLVELGVRILRVYRVADADDVELLVRHVRRQQPSEDMRILVVADDLGRGRMAAWPEARRRIAEIPGVLLLGGVRREDLTPEISASAVIVDPTLTESAARQIYSALEAAGVQTAMAREEAVGRADGLLMEFVALATKGQRLSEVLSAQVHGLGTPETRLRREALRLVCAAHLLGFSVPADALPQALGVDPSSAGEAMSRLAGEHLVVAEGCWWRGLHDLRTEVLFDLLHATPPPTMASTYGEALVLLPDSAHGPGARRAATRIARSIAAATPELDAARRLSLIHEALDPIAEVLRHQLRHLFGHEGDDEAAHAASIIEAADRLDTIAYVHAVLPLVEQNRPATLDLAALAGMAYSSRVSGVNLEIVQPVVRLGQQLPERRSTCAITAASGLEPVFLVDLAKATTIRTAVRLLEAVEGLINLTPPQARDIYEFHVAPHLNSAGEAGARVDGDLRAQLTASLAVLAELRGQNVASALGAVESRAADAVACDDLGCRIELSLVPREPPADAVANLARTYTYSDHEMMVANAVTFAQPSGAELIPSAYAPQPGSDPGSLNEQAVLFARRITDACPEIDLVNVEVWSAKCSPASPTGDDVKSLRAGVLRRRPQVARNIAFQAGVAEAISSETWTARLREQANIARSLVRLLQALPERLRSYDNPGRRRAWIQQVGQAAEAVATMSGRPAERVPVLGAARSEALRQPASEVDEELRAKDGAKAAFECVSGALQQVAHNLDDSRLVRLAGSRFADVPALMRKARIAGDPVFSGIGETLPQEIDDLAGFLARLLTSLELDEVARAIREVRTDPKHLNELLTEAATFASMEDAERVVTFLDQHNVTAGSGIILNDNPIPAWRQYRAVITVGMESWSNAVEILQGWSPEERTEFGLAGRVVAVLVEGGKVLPLGLGFFASVGEPLPLLEDDLTSIAEGLNAPLGRSTVRARIQARSRELETYSYEVTRRANRDPSWSEVPTSAVTPTQTAVLVREDFQQALEYVATPGSDDAEGYAGSAAKLLLVLCEAVDLESGIDQGLASQLASIDITSLSGEPLGSSAQLYAAAQAAAIESDRTSLA
jgi:hypothetical protein